MAVLCLFLLYLKVRLKDFEDHERDPQKLILHLKTIDITHREIEKKTMALDDGNWP